MPGIAGINASFSMGTKTTPSTLVDLSRMIASIDPEDDTNEIDGTTLQAGSAEMIAGFQTTGVNITFNWTPAVQAAVDAFREGTDLDYEYGPAGNGVGKTIITGTANVVHAGKVPGSSPTDVSQITARVRFNSATTEVKA